MNEVKNTMCNNLFWTVSSLYSQEQFYNILLENYPWATDYCYYYVYVIYANRDSVIPTLNLISQEDRACYTPQKAFKYYQAYEKSRLSFATIIPTYNRPKAVKFLLEYAAPLYRRLGIDLIIYDSSSNNETFDVVKKIQSTGYYNVMYHRYTGEFDGFSLDHKLIQAYDDYAEEYDYIWLCRDGLIPVVDEILEKVRYYKKKGIDCIIVDTKSRVNGLEMEQYYIDKSDCANFLLDQVTRLQTLGMLIFSGKFARRLLDTVPLDDTTYSLWQMAAPFHAFANGDCKVVFCTKNVFALNEYASTTHFWSKASKMMEQWAYRWNLVISNMPQEYEMVKEKCMMVYTVDFHPFTARNILEMRGYGGLNQGMVSKYKEYLPKVTMTPVWYFYVVAILPKCLARLVLRLDRVFHGFFSALRLHMIPDNRDK